MTATPRRIGLRFAAIALCAGALGLVLGGCAAPRSTLGTSSNPCFRTLPAARQAVDNMGRLLGVRYVTVAQINAGLRHTRQDASILAPGLVAAKSAVCAIGYQDSFSVSAVTKPWPSGRTSGQMALVLVNLKSGKVLATVLLSRLPLRL